MIGKNAWEPEQDDDEKQEGAAESGKVRFPPLPADIPTEYKPKAHLVLLDSDKEDYGMVEYTKEEIAWAPGQGEIVGTWSRAPVDKFIYIGLTTSIEALHDRAIQIWKFYSEQRRAQKAKVSRPRARKTVKGVEPTPPEPVPTISAEDQAKFDALRAKLRRK